MDRIWWFLSRINGSLGAGKVSTFDTGFRVKLWTTIGQSKIDLREILNLHQSFYLISVHHNWSKYLNKIFEWFQVNFIEYLQVVYDAIGRDGPECNDALTEGIAALELLVDDTNEWGGLQGW